ncbi:MAG: glycerate kinase [Chloroflexi bacterium]|jgi:glycerate kinase|nr:glycerate kinase [Chloroflexota bacterium]MCH2305100.1 glycerate kinase [SAR202 cluster bacterium]|tara:strand:- start:29004 stop:30152 length:1149 start_codon:yes stop_codon:yes gene_type:complete
MNILISPQSYKGSISALNTAKAISIGVKNVLPEANTIILPVADGGDGTLETLVDVSNGQIKPCKVLDPLGVLIDSNWGGMGDNNTAVIEMAKMSGLALVEPEKRNPMFTTTYGLGETIKHALDEGYRDFIIGIGGSATNDGGVGMAQALGGLFLDSSGEQIKYGAEGLSKLVKIDLSNMDDRLQETKFLVASDVTNPLLGELGASAVYGPQKGASKEMIPILEKAMINYVDVAKKSLELDVSEVPGSGAAGGLGAGLMMFVNAELKPGVDIVLDKINFNKYLNNIDLVITGEGQMDYQTVYNKAPYGVALRAKKFDIPVIGISGSLGDSFQDVNDNGIDAVTSISQGAMNLDQLTASVSELIIESTEQVMRFIKVGSKLDFN